LGGVVRLSVAAAEAAQGLFGPGPDRRVPDHLADRLGCRAFDLGQQVVRALGGLGLGMPGLARPVDDTDDQESVLAVLCRGELPYRFRAAAAGGQGCDDFWR
jgi:hypothetical protein